MSNISIPVGIRKKCCILKFFSIKFSTRIKKEFLKSGKIEIFKILRCKFWKIGSCRPKLSHRIFFWCSPHFLPNGHIKIAWKNWFSKKVIFWCTLMLIGCTTGCRGIYIPKNLYFFPPPFPSHIFSPKTKMAIKRGVSRAARIFLVK